MEIKTAFVLMSVLVVYISTLIINIYNHIAHKASNHKICQAKISIMPSRSSSQSSFDVRSFSQNHSNQAAQPNDYQYHSHLHHLIEDRKERVSSLGSSIDDSKDRSQSSSKQIQPTTIQPQHLVLIHHCNSFDYMEMASPQIAKVAVEGGRNIKRQ